MSTTKQIRDQVMRLPLGKPFTNKRFLKLGSRVAVDKALSRLVQEDTLQRIIRGVYMRPKYSQYIKGRVWPAADQVAKLIAKERGEILQMQGAEAARRFKLSTQVPVRAVYYTNGLSREVTVRNMAVKLKHVTNRKLQFAGTPPGAALSALWYLGKGIVDSKIIKSIHERLTEVEFETLKNADMPIWMSEAIRKYSEEVSYV